MKSINLKFYGGSNRALLEEAGYKCREEVGDYLRYVVHQSLGRGRFHLTKKSGASDNVFRCHFDTFTGKKTHTSTADESVVGPELARVKAAIAHRFDSARYEAWQAYRDLTRAVSYYQTAMQRERGGELDDYRDEALARAVADAEAKETV